MIKHGKEFEHDHHKMVRGILAFNRVPLFNLLRKGSNFSHKKSVGSKLDLAISHKTF